MSTLNQDVHQAEHATDANLERPVDSRLISLSLK